MKNSNVYLILGSNLGNKLFYLQTAIRHISTKIGDIVKTSSVYESKPWGVTDQENYYNQVVQVSTLLSPHETIEKIHQIEAEMGRVRKRKYDSRIIDIDIAFWNNEIISENQLEIPHPRLHLRKFALLPLLEINPELIHPAIKKSVREILQKCPDTSEPVQLKNEQYSL